MAEDVKARPYLRVSVDSSGRLRSNEEQDHDNRDVWGGWEWGDPYSDEGSAWSRNAQRDDWDRLLSDLEHGRFAADMLVIWESSRGSRKVSEWCRLIELCADAGVKIPVTTHRQIYDPADARDVRSLIDDANDAQYESAKISARTTRAHAARARRGEPGGGPILYGYRHVYGDRGRFVSREIDPDEGPDMVEAFRRVVKGHSLAAIHGDLAQRQRARGGRVITRRQLQTALRNPAYIAKRVHVPGRSGAPPTTTATMRQDGAEVTDAAWPRIIDEATFWVVDRILANPGRRTAFRQGEAVHLLSMIARCDVCGDVLVAKYQHTTRRTESRRYACRSNVGCVKVFADPLDDYATGRMLAYLSRGDVHGGLDAEDDARSVELEGVRADIAELRAAVAELEATVLAREISPRLAGAAEARYEADLAALEDRERELMTPSRLRGVIEPGPDVARRWEPLPMAAKRTVARLLLTPEVLGELRIARAGGGRRVPVEERVVWSRER